MCLCIQVHGRIRPWVPVTGKYCGWGWEWGVCDMQQTWPTEQRSRQKEKILQVIKHSSFYLIVMELQLWSFFYITLHSYYLLTTADQTGKQAFFKMRINKCFCTINAILKRLAQSIDFRLELHYNTYFYYVYYILYLYLLSICGILIFNIECARDLSLLTTTYFLLFIKFSEMLHKPRPYFCDRNVPIRF